MEVVTRPATPCLSGQQGFWISYPSATRLLESVLFQIPSNDPTTFSLVAGLFFGISLLACYLPARRASRIDPQEALRTE